jgi:hypothetical protein
MLTVLTTVVDLTGQLSNPPVQLQRLLAIIQLTGE